MEQSTAGCVGQVAAEARAAHQHCLVGSVRHEEPQVLAAISVGLAPTRAGGQGSGTDEEAEEGEELAATATVS